jgi:hypothetical protein
MSGASWRWAVFLVVTVLAAAAMPRPVEHLPGGDHLLFEAVILRVQDGEPYYAAYKKESLLRGYPTRSPLNWRTPALTMAFAWLPRTTSILFVLLAVSAMAMTTLMLRGLPVFGLIAFFFWQTFNIPATGQAGLYSELWAGVLLAIAVGFFSFGRNIVAAVAVILALFLRELVLPFAVLCAAVAWYRGSRRELVLWIVALIAYAAYYAIHVWSVMSVRPSDPMGHYGSYLAFGGWPAVVGALRASVVMQWTPALLVAILIGLAAAGETVDQAPTHLRLLVGLYAIVFAVVGYSFNAYWGWLLAPVWPVLSLTGARALLRSGLALVRRSNSWRRDTSLRRP